MATFTNHVTIAAPANGTTSHTVDPSSGTVSTGALFTPTAGRLLVVIAYGSVTSTTPTGWTLEASAVESGGLYIWSITAAGGDTFSTTHNGSNYECAFTIIEFPAGSTWVGDVTATGTTAAGANPNLTGLTGTNWVAGAKCLNTNAAVTGAWTSPVIELADANETSAPTDGYWLSVGYIEDYTESSFEPTCTQTGGAGTSEAATFAVNVASGGTPTPADSLGVTDSATHVVDAARAPGDSLSITDSAGRTLAAERAQPDDVGVTDSVASVVSKERSQQDAVGITDSVAAVLAEDVPLTDSLGISDSASRDVTADRPAADTVGLVDNVTVALDIARSIGDQVGISDSAGVDLTAPGSADLNDPLGVSDLLSTTAEILRTAADSLGVTDALTVELERTSSLSDAVGLTDSVTVQAGAAPTPTDGVGVTDSAVAVLDRVVVIADQVAATDAVVAYNPATPLPVAPTQRTYRVSAEVRILVIPATSRTVTAEPEE